MSDEPAIAVNTCEHAWASRHIPGHLVYWVSQCMLCGEVNWDELDREVDELVAAERERLRTHEHEWTRCPDCKQPGQPCPCSGVACCEMERRETAAAIEAAHDERERIAALFNSWIDLLMSEPNSQPPSAWKAGFADLLKIGAAPEAASPESASPEIDGMSEPAPGLWVCYCGAVSPWSWSFPHWDCQGGRPLSAEEIAAREGGVMTEIPQRIKIVKGHPVPEFPGECEPHTASPDGYLQWHDWANQMEKTHAQRQCRGCRLWSVWEPRGDGSMA